MKLNHKLPIIFFLFFSFISHHAYAMEQETQPHKKVVCIFDDNQKKECKVAALETSNMIKSMFEGIPLHNNPTVHLPNIKYTDFNALYPSMEAIANNKTIAICELYKNNELPHLIQQLNLANYLVIPPLTNTLISCIANKCDILTGEEQTKTLQNIQKQLPETELTKLILSNMITLIPRLETTELSTNDCNGNNAHAPNTYKQQTTIDIDCSPKTNTTTVTIKDLKTNITKKITLTYPLRYAKIIRHNNSEHFLVHGKTKHHNLNCDIDLIFLYNSEEENFNNPLSLKHNTHSCTLELFWSPSGNHVVYLDATTTKTTIGCIPISTFEKIDLANRDLTDRYDRTELYIHPEQDIIYILNLNKSDNFTLQIYDLTTNRLIGIHKTKGLNTNNTGNLEFPVDYLSEDGKLLLIHNTNNIDNNTSEHILINTKTNAIVQRWECSDWGEVYWNNNRLIAVRKKWSTFRTIYKVIYDIKDDIVPQSYIKYYIGGGILTIATLIATYIYYKKKGLL